MKTKDNDPTFLRLIDFMFFIYALVAMVSMHKVNTLNETLTSMKTTIRMLETECNNHKRTTPWDLKEQPHKQQKETPFTTHSPTDDYGALAQLAD